MALALTRGFRPRSSTLAARLASAVRPPSTQGRAVIAGLRHASVPTGGSWQQPEVSPQREREVKSACAALTESIQAGDTAWFERVVAQLRSILLERQSEVAALAAEASAAPPKPVSTFPLAKEPPKPVSTFPLAKAAPSNPKPEVDEEPPWLQALRLLERAAAQPTARRSGGGISPSPAAQAAPPAPSLAAPASGYFPARAEPPEDRGAEDSRLQAYLSSFQENSSEETEEDPPWARAIRILEATPVGREPRTQFDRRMMEQQPEQERGTSSSSSSEHAGEDALMARYEKLLRSAKTSGPEDSRRAVRMQSYSNLLQEAERAGKAAPGASLPVRFDGALGRRPALARQPRKLESDEPKVTAAAGVPPTPPPVKAPGQKSSALDDPMSQAVGRGNLVPSLPRGNAEEAIEDAELRKEDFVWSEHEFNDGDKENRRVLKGFTKEFKRMAENTPDGLRDAKLLTAALDLALACVKCYELDKADAIYRRAIGECRRRGLPWDVKCIQDMATLRCKQHRQADAAELLEELATKAPPHPATFINLGTVYNQLRQYEKAESWFRQAVNLKGGTPGREDFWNLGICKKNMGKYDEALPMLEQALAEFQEHEPEHPVTIAKLHSSVGGCLHDMGRFGDAAEQYQKAYDLYVETVGRRSPLFCGAAEGLAKALQKEGHFEESFQVLLEAFEVHATCDAVHPTPLFEGLEMALSLHESKPEVSLSSFAPLIADAVANLEQRGQANDGNAGLVMSRGGKVLSRAGVASEQASELLQRGHELIQQAHTNGEADLAHELLEAEMLLRTLNGSSELQVSTTPSAASATSRI